MLNSGLRPKSKTKFTT